MSSHLVPAGNGARIAATALFALSIGCTDALADTYNLRDYFEALPASYPVQSAASPWSFYTGSATGGSLLTPSGASYYSAEPYQQIGMLVDIGTNGYAGPTLNATFDGVFIHPGSVNPTSVVFRAASATTVTQLTLWSEMVGNGHAGNGFDVAVRSYTGGGYHAIGSFAFDYGATVNSYIETIFGAPVALAAGEFIEISYGNRGYYDFDHGNIDVTVTTGAIAAPVPEPETYAMLVAGLGLLGVMGRRRRQIEA